MMENGEKTFEHPTGLLKKKIKCVMTERTMCLQDETCARCGATGDVSGSGDVPVG